MNVKTIDFLKAICEAASANTQLFSHISNTFEIHEVEDKSLFLLNCSSYLMVSYSMDTQRELWRLLPEQILTSEVEKLLSKFYLYKMEEKDVDSNEVDGEYYNLQPLMDISYELHTLIHQEVTKAREALELYS